jgi:ABC-type transporter MlaC component
MTKYRDIPVLLNPKKKSLFGKEYWDFLHQEQIARFVNLPQKSRWQTYKEALDEYRRFKINRP